MIESTDQLGRPIVLNDYPQKIVSLVPSQTELLYDLGLDKEVCGITKFCIHPQQWYRTKQRVGGTKNLYLQAIHALEPDLIIANKEENTQEQIEELAASFPVWISDVSNLDQALEMIREVGVICNRQVAAQELAERIRTEFQKLQDLNSALDLNRPSAAYFIWKDPYLLAGGDTFIHDLLERSGCQNVAAHLSRYPELNPAEIANLKADVFLLSSEPYPFSEKHQAELKNYFPETPSLLVNGEYYSWYGSRLLRTPEYFQEIMCKIRDTL